MNSMVKTIFVLMFVLSAMLLNAQSVQYTIKGKLIYAHVNVDLPSPKLDSIADSFGFASYVGIEDQKSTKGWKVHKSSKDELVLVLNKNEEVKKLPSSFVIKEKDYSELVGPKASWGVNDFKSPGVVTVDGTTVFTIDGYLDAQEVFLSGSFNNWSTLQTPMKRNAKGWQISIDLPPGKHLYKFIIDGKWKHDKRNRNKVDDWNDGYNSVYFVYNKSFFLDGFQSAKKVEVAGSFNGWQPVRMFKAQGGYQVNMYLTEGTHAYKYIVDGEWILDPENSIVRDDGTGNQNSFTSVGDTFYFRLANHESAKSVFVAGSFNAWNWSELKMYKDKDGWILPYVLPAGNYDYKFKVDNNYILDYANTIHNGAGDYENSVKCIEPNTTFKLRGYTGSEDVILSGSFNGWSTSGYTMEETKDGWEINIYLPKGKHLYKFIVDGVWQHDTANDLWEPNEFGERNSIVWIE